MSLCPVGVVQADPNQLLNQEMDLDLSLLALRNLGTLAQKVRTQETGSISLEVETLLPELTIATQSATLPLRQDSASILLN